MQDALFVEKSSPQVLHDIRRVDVGDEYLVVIVTSGKTMLVSDPQAPPARVDIAKDVLGKSEPTDEQL